MIKVLKSPPLLAPPYKLEHQWLIQRTTRGVQRGPPRANASGCGRARLDFSVLCTCDCVPTEAGRWDPWKGWPACRGRGHPRASVSGCGRAPHLACAVYMCVRTHRGWSLGLAERVARLQRKGASARECVWLRARASPRLCRVHVRSYPQRLVAGTSGKGGPLAEEGGVRARVCLAAGARLTSLVPCTCAFVPT
jgi:hypothetical protein